MSDKVLLTVSREEAEVLLSLRRRSLAVPGTQPFDIEFCDKQNWEKGVYLGDVDDDYACSSIDIPCADLRLEEVRLERHLCLNGVLTANEECYQYVRPKDKLSRIARAKRRAKAMEKAAIQQAKAEQAEAQEIVKQSIARPLAVTPRQIQLVRQFTEDPDWAFKAPTFQGGKIVWVDTRKLDKDE